MRIVPASEPCSVERALRTGQGLDAGDIVDMNIQDAVDGGNRLLIEVHADGRQRAGMILEHTARDAAHIDVLKSRPGAQELHTGRNIA